MACYNSQLKRPIVGISNYLNVASGIDGKFRMWHNREPYYTIINIFISHRKRILEGEILNLIPFTQYTYKTCYANASNLNFLLIVYAFYSLWKAANNEVSQILRMITGRIYSGNFKGISNDKISFNRHETGIIPLLSFAGFHRTF